MPLKRILSVIVIAALLSGFFLPLLEANAETVNFSDVPENHWAYQQVLRLKELKITQGIGNNQFGLGKTITRGEFVTFLVRLMGWALIKPETQSFKDLPDSHHFYSSIETARTHGVIVKDSDNFRPNDPITREEMAVMIVRTLGYDTLANQLSYLGKPFPDVVSHAGYITIGKDLGIINGVDKQRFAPSESATREQAAAMMIRMYDKLNAPLNELHAFYAISSSSQMDKFSQLDSVSFGWARLEYDSSAQTVIINTDRQDNDYYIPDQYSEVISKAQQNGLSRQLMFFVKEEMVYDEAAQRNVPLAEFIITNPEVRKQVINAMVNQVILTEKHGSQTSFDGLVSDFEGLKGESLKSAYNAFLTELKAELTKAGKKLYVTVHPMRRPGLECYDGYDYRTIGKLADRVILMAHDYDATALTDAERAMGYNDTPVTPLDEVYYALKSITDPVTGVEDVSKVWLQLSMDTSQWKLKNGKVDHRFAYHPTYEQLYQRFLKGVSINYSNLSQNPYAKYYNTEDGTDNIIWYEDQRSVAAKIKLAKMFGIKGLSLWRLGNIPEYPDAAGQSFYLNIWQEIIQHYQ
jgi:spore germination protein YaaH